MSGNILVVHELEAVRREAREALERAGHDVVESARLDLARAGRPDLVLLDNALMRPMSDTVAHVKRHEATSGARLIVLAPRESLAEALGALERGADDCIAVPLDAHELIARVKASLRRPPVPLEAESLVAGPVEVDRARHIVRIRDRRVDLAPTEFRLMTFFLENQGRVFSRAELLRRAWGKHIQAGPRTVDVHVRRLRQQLEPFGCDDMIQTVRGFGYRLSVDTTEARGHVEGLTIDGGRL